MSANDTTKDVFRKVWPGGYVENFWNYQLGSEEQVAGIIARFANNQHTCLEIGPGGGLWTRKYLQRFFKHVICLDVIPKPLSLNLPSVTYIEVGDRDFSCANVGNNSIDFVFSFGVFCHFTASACREYLTSIFRVMQPGATAVIMFANYKRHQGIDKLACDKRFAEERAGEGTCWFYADQDTVKEMVQRAGFVDFSDELPDFRDTIAVFKKPVR